MLRSTLLTSLILGAVLAQAAPPAPLKVVPLGKADAPVKGTFNRNLFGEPETLSPMTSQDGYAQEIQGYVLEGLLSRNAETNKWEPSLADNFQVSKDFLTYTFFLRKEAKFSDGHPVTADDVKFSIEYVRNPAYKASHRIPFYEDVDKVEAVDPQTVKVTMKKKYFLNEDVLGSGGYTPILPKHIYEDPNKKWTGAPLVGSGAYKVETYNRGKNLVLVRRSDWWAKDFPENKGTAKFERINFRFIKEENLEIEMVKKGDIDYMEPIRPDNYMQKATGPDFENKIYKKSVKNKRPKNWSFIGWNNKNILFKDKNVRIALTHLLNRELLIQKFFYDLAVPASGPQYYLSSFKDPSTKPLEYNPEKAKKLLKAAGWEDKEKKGVLQKEIDGKTVEFRFSLLLPNRDTEKWFTIYKEDLKKAGIDMEIKLIEWSTFTKLLEEQKFDAVTMSWGGGSIEDDLKQIWHSDSARMGGSNFVSYANPAVDKLIDSARQEMNEKKRMVLWQKASKLISDDQPYTFMFNLKTDLYLLNKRIGFDKDTYVYGLSYPNFFVAP